MFGKGGLRGVRPAPSEMAGLGGFGGSVRGVGEFCERGSASRVFWGISTRSRGLVWRWQGWVRRVFDAETWQRFGVDQGSGKYQLAPPMGCE